VLGNGSSLLKAQFQYFDGKCEENYEKPEDRESSSGPQKCKKMGCERDDSTVNLIRKITLQ
jgi:hypothetical protein